MFSIIKRFFKRSMLKIKIPTVDLGDKINIEFENGRKITVYVEDKQFVVDILYMFEWDGEIKNYKVIKNK